MLRRSIIVRSLPAHGFTSTGLYFIPSTVVNRDVGAGRDQTRASRRRCQRMGGADQSEAPLACPAVDVLKGPLRPSACPDSTASRRLGDPAGRLPMRDRACGSGCGRRADGLPRYRRATPPGARPLAHDGRPMADRRDIAHVFENSGSQPIEPDGQAKRCCEWSVNVARSCYINDTTHLLRYPGTSACGPQTVHLSRG